MRFNRKAIVDAKDEKLYCRCVHNSSLHDAKGCHGEIIRFMCERTGHVDYRNDHSATKCIVTLPCQCKFVGVKAQKSGTIVLQSEKQ